MYTNTRFGELLKALPKNTFRRCVEHYQSDKHNKGFDSWDHLISMIYAQLSGSRSLRELEVSYNSHAAHHYHLGCGPIKRSTLSDANASRDASVFESFCSALLTQAHGKLKRDITDLLYLLDSSPICLFGRGYEWTQGQSMPHVPGLKLHLLYAPDVMLPCTAKVTRSTVNDLEYGREIEIEPGAKYVFDKGYCDYNWWYRIDQAGAFFVTRLKCNAAVQELKSNPIEEKDTSIILSDEDIQFKNKHPGGGRVNHYMKPLRRIVVHREDHDKSIVLVTNQMNTPAREIAEAYKRRWAIELWFKWIKQNLKIKQFLGRSENAVKIQLLIALITYLLAYIYRQLSGSIQSLYLWMAELKSTLFQRSKFEYEVLKRRRRNKANFKKHQAELLL
ncbi:MAG: IS4 family transposase [Gammaproteobacteria bacterium]|nr:IS4 family transposase [Gammaproteobacteria bacterium]